MCELLKIINPTAGFNEINLIAVMPVNKHVEQTLLPSTHSISADAIRLYCYNITAVNLT